MNLQNHILKSTPHALWELANIFKDANFELFLVGGFLRDIALGREASDFDFATNAKPSDMRAILSDYELNTIGEEFGTIGLNFCGIICEITTFRSERAYIDNRHPSEVHFARDIACDLQRRDFSVNALAFDMIKREICDLCGARRDMRLKTVRAIGNADERFREDALRILRAFSLMARFDFTLHSETLSAIIKNKNLLKNISSERIKNEMNKIIPAKHAHKALLIMKQNEILDFNMPKNFSKIPKIYRAFAMCLDSKNHAFFYPKTIQKARILGKIIESLNLDSKSARDLKILFNFLAKKYGLNELEIAIKIAKIRGIRVSKYFHKQKIKKLMKLKINGHDIARVINEAKNIGKIEREIQTKMLRFELANARNAQLKELWRIKSRLMNP